MADNEMLDFDELKKESTVLTDPVIPESIQNAPMSDGTVSIDSDGLIITEDDIADVNNEGTPYSGPGVVIDTPKDKEPTTYKVGPMANKERVEGIENTLNDMDEQIREAHEEFMKITKGGKEIPKTGEEKIADPKEVTIILDKAGMGEVTFTEEEKKRIEKAKKIRLVEVTDKKLSTIKIKKKLKRGDDFAVIQKSFDRSLSSVIAMASGYTAKMANISALEAIKLTQRPGKDTANSILEKWSLIYSKLKNVSIGDFKTFDDFISNTAFTDYNSFIYALLCSSYPEEDVIAFTCRSEECSKLPNAEFEIKYKNRGLIRSDLITDEQASIMSDIINAAPILTEAKKVHEQSPVNQTLRFAFDDESGIIIDFTIPSVKEVVERLYNRLDESLLTEENQIPIIFAHNIKAIYIPDYDGGVEDEYEYNEITDLNHVVQVVKQFNEYQTNLIGEYLSSITTKYSIRFGLPKVECPRCHHDYGEYDVELERIVFQRVQQRMETQIV